MSDNELVSVIISTYNADNTLEESLESIFTQTYNNLEVLLMDDFSTDSSQEIINRMKKKYPNLKTFRNNKNLGLTKSLNKLLKKTSGKYIARHDVDDLSDRKRIASQVHFINENNLDGCTTRAKIKNSKKTIPYLSFYFPPKLVLKYKNPFIHGSLMLRSEVINEIGFYDENFYYAQDYKLMKDLVISNYNIQIMKKTLYTLNTDNNISSNHKSEQQYFADCVKKDKIPLNHKEI